MLSTKKNHATMLLLAFFMVPFSPLLLEGCSKKGVNSSVLVAQESEALSLPHLRPLSLPPRYNLDGGQDKLSQPTASLTDKESLRISNFSNKQNADLADGKINSKDSFFLQKLQIDRRDPNIRRELAENNKQPVPLSQPLLRAIQENSKK